MLVILLTVLAIAPLTYPGFFEAQSGFLPTFNVQHISDAPHWGRPADPPRSEGKLPYLIAWPFLQVSGSGVTAIKWGYGLAFLLGALGVFAWTRSWLGAKGAVLAAAVYTYLPWHLNTVYVRGAYAEAWLWAFWPFMLWAVDRLNERRPLSVLAAVVVGVPLLAATFWAQPGLAALAVPLFIAYGGALSARQPWPLLRLLETLALVSILLWLVARRLPEGQVPFTESFLYPFQLLSAAWGEGGSFQLGLAAVGLSIVAVALCAGHAAEKKERSELLPSPPSLSLGAAVWFWLATLLVLVLLSLPLSAWFWQLSGFDALLTYPWQLLALAGLPLALLAGSVVRLDERLATLPAWAGLVALVVLASYPYLELRFTQVDPGPEPVALLQPVAADNGQILILDTEIVPPTEVTPTLTLTLTWQAVQPVADDYTIFVHVLDQDDTKVAQRDSRPCDGECPTNTWQPGAIITDRHQLTLAPSHADDQAAADVPLLPPGPYRLAVGLYLLDTGDRATVVGRDDRTVFLNVP